MESRILRVIDAGLASTMVTAGPDGNASPFQNVYTWSQELRKFDACGHTVYKSDDVSLRRH